MIETDHKYQPVSGNRIPASFIDVLNWTTAAWDSIKRSTILSGIEQCFMDSKIGEPFDVKVKDQNEVVNKPPKA